MRTSKLFLFIALSTFMFMGACREQKEDKGSLERAAEKAEDGLERAAEEVEGAYDDVKEELDGETDDN
ncbi:hypothetical protein BFP77_04180 [Maribacter sp. 4U21]|uniref:hypothetical protein n=1 Tax=Maribacter sp. 4U21 TaxID=1889779 RepID=UPI000C15B19F|nr:hypothetical protein [Maribacter sp. 4U21]PIB30512.1 hypothetical protein BFP77_04180 [Maribacter sp. 4U21]